MRRSLTMAAGLGWGLQFAFLSPALALVLVSVFGASDAQVGLVLAIANAAGLAASIVLPLLADRARDYVRPMILCAVLTLVLAGALSLAPSLVWATVALVVLGAPAGVGNALLFAHVRHSGATTAETMNVRAAVSFAWVAGPPIASFVMAAAGPRSVFALLAGVALYNLVLAVLLARGGRVPVGERPEVSPDAPPARVHWAIVVTVMAVFAVLQATNTAGVAVMNLLVTTMGESIAWAGVALGLAAGLEVPALILIGRLGHRFSALSLLMAGCVVGATYYGLVAFGHGLVPLLAGQLLNAAFYAVVAGIGLTYFQGIVDRPGLATGLYMNASRLGSIFSGAIIAGGTATGLGYAGVYALNGVLTVVALAVVTVLRLRAKS
ncbi:MFS transporter [Propioniciclava tarda]|uniref:MFS transporter n=1 Tax=Propioniciclava tarda TaxID=433330 RepID=A0A4Q9KNB9_PROTD|nr:MFS transporter [Propioniciclava tarda]TBT95954.1 MFS transporter [Propioniciclava tarda]SMO41891.1 MFS transporter, SET family, sugar efflux transporter [Propioniciclava tarda]HOA87935.1 MFS transporter [Propioniciclava tarda]HQA30053.1 MFS transporter [Propioniciclava tarda]HQD59838.1 MFS transporter [Propioniciclava tarda]